MEESLERRVARLEASHRMLAAVLSLAVADRAAEAPRSFTGRVAEEPEIVLRTLLQDAADRGLGQQAALDTEGALDRFTANLRLVQGFLAATRALSEEPPPSPSLGGR